MELAAHWELLIILLLILLNGYFAGAEIAVLTARRGRLEQQAAAGNRKARSALSLAGDANRFLATVQVGITFVGTFAAAFGGASLVARLAAQLETLPYRPVARYSGGISLAIVATGIAYVSLVLGELVPKRIALGNAERLAGFVAPPMVLLSWIGRPVVWLLETSTSAVLFLLRQHNVPESSVSIDDIRHLIETGTAEGVLEPTEQRAAISALRLGDRSVREIQTPRIDMDALDVETPPDDVLRAVVEAGFTRLPVYDKDLDHVVGFVYIKDVLKRQQEGKPLHLREMMRPPLFVPETLAVDRLPEVFRAHGTQMAIVLDEYGGTEGLVTIEDVMEELVGEIRDEIHRDEDLIVDRNETSLLVDGTVSLHDLLQHLRGRMAEAEPPRGVSTIAGLVLSELGRLPKIGDTIEWNGARIEVVDMDGRRIDRVMLTLLPPEEPPARE